MNTIQGWFDFDDIYSDMVNRYNDAHFVEIGSWLGKSSYFMANLIKESGKNIRFDCVDIWELTDDDPDLHKYTDKKCDLYYTFLLNIKNAIKYIKPIKLNSVLASTLYEDKSLDFVFIDANHNYDFVKKDIEAWLPKVKEGGYIGGHDYNYGSVKLAVDESFASKISIHNVSWLFQSQKI